MLLFVFYCAQINWTFGHLKIVVVNAQKIKRQRIVLVVFSREVVYVPYIIINVLNVVWKMFVKDVSQIFS